MINAPPLIVNPVPTIDWALRPLETSNDPAKELEPVPFNAKTPPENVEAEDMFDTQKLPDTEAPESK